MSVGKRFLQNNLAAQGASLTEGLLLYRLSEKKYIVMAFLSVSRRFQGAYQKYRPSSLNVHNYLPSYLDLGIFTVCSEYLSVSQRTERAAIERNCFV